jgi:exopolyphosphatase/guanosine-5'-triphosphate,3'-diphosphate pyrophosphatase
VNTFGRNPKGPAPAELLSAARALSRRSGCEQPHCRQVERLSLRLFDELAGLHGLGAQPRLYLQLAAVLHDIGVPKSPRAHHKTALRMILADRTVPLDERQRAIVASVARYHRKAPPAERHTHYAGLSPDDRETVRRLAAVLRVGDGLDRTHTETVRDLTCDVSADAVVIRCEVTGDPAGEFRAAGRKGDLFEQVFARKLLFERQDTAPARGV